LSGVTRRLLPLPSYRLCFFLSVKSSFPLPRRLNSCSGFNSIPASVIRPSYNRGILAQSASDRHSLLSFPQASPYPVLLLFLAKLPPQGPPHDPLLVRQLPGIGCSRLEFFSEISFLGRLLCFCSAARARASTAFPGHLFSVSSPLPRLTPSFVCEAAHWQEVFLSSTKSRF